MFLSLFSTKRFLEPQNLTYLTYQTRLTCFSHIFSFSVTCRHFEKTLIAASFLSSLINESQLNYETLLHFHKQQPIYLNIFHIPLTKKHILTIYNSKCFALKRNSNGSFEVRFVLWRQQLQ